MFAIETGFDAMDQGNVGVAVNVRMAADNSLGMHDRLRKGKG